MGQDPNLELVEKVAVRLGDLRHRLVFLGGAATGLLLTDPAASPIRATKDVDVIIQIGSSPEYRAIEKALQIRGFRPDRSPGAPLCRWVIEGMQMDVMPTDPGILGFSNRWYPKAMETSTTLILPSGIDIRLVSAPCFLATKLEAFLGRGRGDFMGSHDLEDVVSLLDGRAEVVDEVLAATLDLRRFIADTLGRFLQEDSFIGSVQGNLPPDRASQARFSGLMARIQRLSRMAE